MFFDNWTDIRRVLIVGTLAYVALVLLLRISGKRTLSKMNAFDLVVTVSLGSTLATVLLTSNVALAEGIAALALLIFLQYLIAWLSVRSETFRQFVSSAPTLLAYDGRLLREAMRRERVSEEEIMAALRDQGANRIEDVHAVVLETEGKISVLKKSAGDCESPALASVRGIREARGSGNTEKP